MTTATMNETLPNSLEVKDKTASYPPFPRWLYVHELRSLLSELNDDDWILPNNIGNLTIHREGENLITGMIDMYWNSIEWFNDEE